MNLFPLKLSGLWKQFLSRGLSVVAGTIIHFQLDASHVMMECRQARKSSKGLWSQQTGSLASPYYFLQ